MLKRVRGIRASMVIVVLLVLPLAACNGEDSSVTLPEGATLPEISAPETRPPETEAPTTAAPAPETPATEAQASTSEADGDEVPVWVWVLLGLVLVGLVAWLAARAGSRSGSQAQQGQQYPPQQQPPPPPPPSEQPPAPPSSYEEPPQGT